MLQKSIYLRIKDVMDSREYKYMNSFCNFVKHHNIANVGFKIENIMDFYIHSFEYGEPYSEIFFSEYFKYFEKVIEELLKTLQVFIDYANAENLQNNQ